MGSEPLQSITKVRTLIDEVQAAVDRYISAATPAEGVAVP